MKDARDLAERLARERRAGDEFSQGGWHHTTSALPPATSSRFLVLLPFLVLAFLILASTLGLLYVTGRI